MCDENLNKEFKLVIPPTIKPMKIALLPPLLLRTNNINKGENNYYNLYDIKKRIIGKGEMYNFSNLCKVFKKDIIFEMARNPTLKQQMLDEDLEHFQKWIWESEKITIVEV